MRVFMFAALFLTALTAGCGSDGGTTTPPTSGNKTVDVFTLSSAFSPNFVQIAQGDTVRFTIRPAQNGEGHDVTFNATPGAPPNIKVTLNAVIPLVFSTKGTFHYNCFVHPGMSGDIVVQ